MSSKVLYRFNWDCGRMGSLEGIFVSSDEDVAKALGEEVYFGEVLGKHSEIYGTLDAEDLTVLTDDQEFIDKAIEYELVPSGFCPLDYIEDED